MFLSNKNESCGSKGREKCVCVCAEQIVGCVRTVSVLVEIVRANVILNLARKMYTEKNLIISAYKFK